jgi:hypothetical protein
VIVYGCRVPGCEWTGDDLDSHLREAHGWTRDELQELAEIFQQWQREAP